MELKIKLSDKNDFPIGGVLIKHASISFWVKEIQNFGLALNTIEVFPIPDIEPNSIWGCLIITNKSIDNKNIGKNETCQLMASSLFIPERTKLFPIISDLELKALFQTDRCVIHPEFGLVELKEPLGFKEIMVVPLQKKRFVTRPQKTVFIPQQVKSFQVKPLSPEESLKKLEENTFPKKEKMEDKPLNTVEKGKLGLYKLFFKKSNNSSDQEKIERTGVFSMLSGIVRSLGKDGDSWADSIQNNFEDLENRNRKEIDKLLDLLKNNPEEGLKYAIPLDDKGTSRGGEIQGGFSMSRRWSEFSLFGNGSGSGIGSGSIDLGNHFNVLEDQYRNTALALIAQGDSKKAAFVYMKLLKDNYLAAKTLEDGKHYQEAASLYLKENNKRKAAECYEKGNMIAEAITLYETLKENEKVGDLHVLINDKQQADVFYKMVIDDYLTRYQHLKASSVYRNKINDVAEAQYLLLQGWKSNKDSFNCLKSYFSHIDSVKALGSEIRTIYKNDVVELNREVFLSVMKHEYKKKNELSDEIKEMAYEIIAKQIAINPSIVSELKEFNTTDKQLVKDTLRFKVRKRNY